MTEPQSEPPPPPEVTKSYLVQRFARLGLGPFHILGYSIAGEESVVQVPELDVCFDIGRAPYFALTSNIVCITHGHMDHLAGLAYYLSQRHFQGMRPGTVLLPRELERPVDDLLRVWRSVERQGTPYQLIGMQAGQTYHVRKDFAIRALRTHHGDASLGFSLISVREKLKPEFFGKTGPELVELKKQGVEIQYRTEVPLVTYLGDTAAGPVFDAKEVREAQVLITEITFFESAHKPRAKAGRHLHLDHFLQILPTLENQHIVITHVSRRTGIRKAMRLLRKRAGDEAMKRIHFLMDFEGASVGGDVEDAGPARSEDAPE